MCSLRRSNCEGNDPAGVEDGLRKKSFVRPDYDEKAQGLKWLEA